MHQRAAGVRVDPTHRGTADSRRTVLCAKVVDLFLFVIIIVSKMVILIRRIRVCRRVFRSVSAPQDALPVLPVRHACGWRWGHPVAGRINSFPPRNPSVFATLCSKPVRNNSPHSVRNTEECMHNLRHYFSPCFFPPPVSFLSCQYFA